jgi:hypothetical protein
VPHLSLGVPMSDERPERSSAVQQQLEALSRWENEGGAGPHGTAREFLGLDLSQIPPLTNAELVQLRVRVIALENLMIMLLAQGSDEQLELAREMAAYISPRPGFTPHPLTIQAAAHMNNLVERATHYRSVTPP